MSRLMWERPGSEQAGSGKQQKVETQHTFVRPYEQADRDAVSRIAADTAFFGDPVEVFLDDRRLFVDAFCRYYMDIEPQHCWVVDAEGDVAGFLFGAVDTDAQERTWAFQVLLPTLVRAFAGQYHLGRRTWRYVFRSLAATLSGEFPIAELERYPAHLHINLDERYRGLGLGRRLIQVYLDQLCELGIEGVHLNTTSKNVAAVHLYEGAGFRLLASRSTNLWQPYLAEPVENRVYGLRLLEKCDGG